MIKSVTFFGTYNTATTPRVQVLIEGLRAHNVSVAECNVPLQLGTADRVAILQQPWRLPLLGVHLAWCWFRLLIKRFGLPASEAVIIGHLGQFDILLARVLFRRQLLLDYMISGRDTAQDRRASGSLKSTLLGWLDNTALQAATTIIVDTEEHLHNLPEKYRHKGVVVAVGAPEAWFTPTKRDAPSQPVRIIFYGAFTPLQGAATIAEAIRDLVVPVEVTLVGNGQDLSTVKQLLQHTQIPIRWLDWVGAADLPQLVAEHDICLGIFGTTPKAQKVVPNKVYQGAAAGCAVITSDTAPQRRILGEAAVFVPAGDHIALTHAITTLVSQPKKLRGFQRAAQQLAADAFKPAQIVAPLIDVAGVE